MAGYTRQSTIADGNVIDAVLFNDEFDKLLAAFVATSGHKHDGTAAEGAVIPLIGDTGVATPLNKILIDTTNNHLEFYTDVSSAAVQQLRIEDGAIVPILDNDIDLGTSSLEFKDGHFDGEGKMIFKERGSYSAIWKKGPQEKKAVEKGQELGFFAMGSTVILIFSKDLNLNKHVLSENKSVKFGETLLTI